MARILVPTMKRIAKLLSLSADEWALLFRATCTFVVCSISLRLVRFESIRGWAVNAKRTSRPVPIATLIWATQVASRLVPKTSCLARALAATRLLSENGYKSTLHIGVNRTGEAFGAHAWVEHEELIVIGGAEASDFKQLYSWRHGSG